MPKGAEKGDPHSPLLVQLQSLGCASSMASPAAADLWWIRGRWGKRKETASNVCLAKWAWRRKINKWIPSLSLQATSWVLGEWDWTTATGLMRSSKAEQQITQNFLFLSWLRGEGREQGHGGMPCAIQPLSLWGWGLDVLPGAGLKPSCSKVIYC